MKKSVYIFYIVRIFYGFTRKAQKKYLKNNNKNKCSKPRLFIFYTSCFRQPPFKQNNNTILCVLAVSLITKAITLYNCGFGSLPYNQNNNKTNNYLRRKKKNNNNMTKVSSCLAFYYTK